jgi:hypothetical protein
MSNVLMISLGGRVSVVQNLGHTITNLGISFSYNVEMN